MSGLKKKKILLVEDDNITALFEKKQLEKEGYIVITASGGGESVEIINSGKEDIDLVLMDIDLGKGMDGTQAAAEILKTRDIPVIFISSHIENEIVSRTENIASYGYVVKSSGLPVLDASIKTAFRLFETGTSRRKKEHGLYEDNDDGNPRAPGGTETNTAESRRIESELDRINERYSLIVNNISEGVILSDLNMNVMFITPSIIERHGYTLEELNTIPLEKRMSPESYERLMKAASDELTAEKLANPANDLFRVMELEFYRKDGTGCWTESTFRLIRDAKGEPAGILGVGRDISERKQAEDAVLESEARFRSLSEDMPASICSFLPDSTITYANSALSSVTGYSRDMVIGKRFFDLLEPDEREKVQKAIASLTVGNPSESHVQLHVSPDGESRFIEWKNRAFFDMKGKAVRFLSVGIDITERWLYEQRVRKLLDEKEIILKEVHHRIKNNMNVVFSLLMLNAEMQDTPAVKEILVDAAGRVRAMMLLYDRLYRSESGTSISLKEYLPDLVNSIVQIFPMKYPVSTRIHVDEIILGADLLSSLGIIISELVTNSMKYAFRGRNDGMISLEVTRKNSNVTVLFRDNGPGFPEGVSLENSRGFGLQLVDMLVQQIKGTVSLKSEAGTLFQIDFKLK